jgi:hypothetical protein
MYQDRAGTTLVSGAGDVVGKMLDLSGEGNHSVAPSDAARPTLRIDANGKYYLERDIVDDNLPITWPTNLTSTGVIYTATGDYTTKDSGLVLSGATDYKQPKYDYGRIVMASESRYDAKIIKYLDAKRGRAYQLGPELVTNGGFDSDVGWQKGSGWTISGGVAVATATSNPIYQGGLYGQAGTISGKKYLVSFTVSATSGTVQFRSTTFYEPMSTGYHQVSFTADSVNIHFYGSSFTGTLDNVSVREILL